jgi:nucleoside-diphosphate-sugar epimerase
MVFIRDLITHKSAAIRQTPFTFPKLKATPTTLLCYQLAYDSRSGPRPLLISSATAESVAGSIWLKALVYVVKGCFIIKKMSLLILGGSGFVGRAVSKYAVSQGLKVFSLSLTVPDQNLEPWQQDVQYVKGNVMHRASYIHLLPEVTAVVHCIRVPIGSRTPLDLHSRSEGSYEQLNRDTAFKAIEAVKPFKTRFVFVSAEYGLFFSLRYIETKLEVEERLYENYDKMSYAILRPGFMYNNALKLRAAAGAINLMHYASPILKYLSSQNLISQGSIPSKALHVDVVAKSIVLCAMLPEFDCRTLTISDIIATARLPDLVNRSS